VSVRDASWRRALLLAPLLWATASAQSPSITEADLERAKRAVAPVTERDVEAARRLHPMPGEAELSRVPIPSTPKVDALPRPVVPPRTDLEAIARGYRAIEDGGAAGALPSSGPALLVFVSFTLPQATLARLVEQAAEARATLVLRGLVNGSLTQTVARAQSLIGSRQVAFQIDPLAFDRFGVTQVPSFVLLRRGTEAHSCEAGSCFAADAFVLAAGDVSVRYALEFIGRTAPGFAGEAQSFLRRLKG
jgi:conjugal transfer pilus assembly protein TrbC